MSHVGLLRGVTFREDKGRGRAKSAVMVRLRKSRGEGLAGPPTRAVAFRAFLLPRNLDRRTAHRRGAEKPRRTLGLRGNRASHSRGARFQLTRVSAAPPARPALAGSGCPISARRRAPFGRGSSWVARAEGPCRGSPTSASNMGKPGIGDHRTGSGARAHLGICQVSPASLSLPHGPTLEVPSPTARSQKLLCFKCVRLRAPTVRQPVPTRRPSGLLS